MAVDPEMLGNIFDEYNISPSFFMVSCEQIKNSNHSYLLFLEIDDKIDDEQLVVRFAHFLEYSDENILTRASMPMIDLGDIPTTHSFMRTES